ncbi:peroxiredoxin [Gottschalkia purinilytica]|uniref:Peroxiredoxin n=1 Tax=Gottschalkia purinilytica TaxID=1503 RepID=A0A0L0WFB9_GOTPU|nr:redoxin domain-containing protein [Gottschalkia purinilytica]KNF10182.1 peroxiredoxin [Gottschalkia purinilytica]
MYGYRTYNRNYRQFEPKVIREYYDDIPLNSNSLALLNAIKRHICVYLTIGDPAPNFTLEGIVDGKIKNMSLDDYDNKWKVIFFYNYNFEHIFYTELFNLVKKYNRFLDINTIILPISTDSIYCHKNFLMNSEIGKQIKFPLLSDKTHLISKAYGVYNEKESSAYGGTFIVCPNGIIRAWSVNPQNVDRNIDELIRQLEVLQSSQ